MEISVAISLSLLLQFATAIPPLECPKTKANGRTLVVSAQSKKSTTGKWRDDFLARAETSASSDRFNWNITHSVLECDGKRYLHLKGTSDEESVADLIPKLKFHKRTGEGVAVINGGRTVQKIRVTNENYAVAFTDRPLNDNEMFELRLDERIPNMPYGICVGLITKSPDSIQITEEMHLSEHVFEYCTGLVWGRGKMIFENYGDDISLLKAGDTVGVMRKESVADLIPKLKFHKRTGEGVAVINGGRTVQKIRVTNETDAVAFTDRPLNDDEIFELRLDETIPNMTNGLCVGLITKSPDSIQITEKMHLSEHVYVYCTREAWGRGKQIFKNYGDDISLLKVGDTFGVMRSEFDVIHFFINGVDQGPAETNVQSPVYGMIDLWLNASKATIIYKN